MQIERRALYNLMRLNWLLDPNLNAEAWQVDDYRSTPIELLFERLQAHDIHLDKAAFSAFAQDFDSPEEMTDAILADSPASSVTQDQVYLIVFELWRRLLPEKTCLSIFCDELDYQIHLYDSGQTRHVESIQDAIANLQVILDENADQGTDPQVVFQAICSGCANDIESFLYDYISDQIDSKVENYAADLLDGFGNYVKDLKWFDFLRVRLLALTDPEVASELVYRLEEHYAPENNLEFNLELLAFMVETADREVFLDLVKKTLPLIEIEEDFQDLLAISADYFRRLDMEAVEQAILQIIGKRAHLHADSALSSDDPQIAELLGIFG